VPHGGDVGAEGAGAKIRQAGARRFTGKRAYAGDERRLDLLAGGLADRAAAEAYSQRLKDHGFPAAVVASP